MEKTGMFVIEDEAIITMEIENDCDNRFLVSNIKNKMRQLFWIG
jgi:hypothetical protein